MFKFLVVLVMAMLMAPDLQDDTQYRSWLKEHVGLERPETSSTSPSTYRWKEPIARSSTPAVDVPGEAAVDGPGRLNASVGTVVTAVVLVLAVIGGLSIAVLCVYQSNLFGRFLSQGIFDFDTIFNHQKIY